MSERVLAGFRRSATDRGHGQVTGMTRRARSLAKPPRVDPSAFVMLP